MIVLLGIAARTEWLGMGEQVNIQSHNLVLYLLDIPTL